MAVGVVVAMAVGVELLLLFESAAANRSDANTGSIIEDMVSNSEG